MRFFAGVLLLFNAVSVLAVYKDDAYTTDWHIPLIGPSIASATFFHRPDAESRASLIYTLTTRSVLAALNPKDGELVWRQQLADVAGGNGLARGGNGVVVSATGNGVSSFDAGSGRLVWDNEFASKVVDLGVTAGNAVAALFEDGAVRLLAEKTGDVAWEWRGLDSKDTPVSIHVTNSEVIVASSHAAKQLHLTTIALATGQASSPSSIAAHVDIPSKHQVLHGDGILSWTENSGRTLKFAPWGRKVSPIAVEIPNDVRETSLYALTDKIAVHFKTHGDSWIDLYHVNAATQEVSKLYALFPRIGAHSASSLSTSGDLTYLVWNLPGETILYDTRQPEVLATYVIPNQTINAAFGISEVAPRPDGASYAMRTFVSSTAPGFVGDSHLIRNGEVAWSRKESLSSIVASTWVELLDQASEEIVDELKVETHTNIAAAYVHRVKRHLNELVLYGPDWLQALPHRIYNAFLTAETVDTEHTGKWRDFFGFRKFAIVVTAEGGLAAIDVGKGGEVVWEALLASPEVRFQGVLGIYEVRKGTVGVVTTGGDYVEYDAFEGTLLHHDKLAATVKATALFDTPTKAKAVVALLDNNDAVVLPLGGDYGLEPVHLSIKESARAVKGIRVSGSSQPVTTWTFVPPASEEVTSLATRPAHDPVASIGRVLGDRSVMYKYLNQHLLVITTINPVLSTASVYLLDAVSGSILHSATHAGADTSQPIVATVSENWLVYTFFGDNDVVATPGAAKGYQLVVSELYESEFKNDRGALGPAANVSSFTTNGKPYVLSQSYIFPSPVTSFAVTSTKQGITSREVLTLLAGTSQIYTIPKRVLDPRRPVGRDTDAAEKEEGLFRYTPVIDIDPKAVLTHERKMLGLTHVATTPSMLESTSLVFAYGGDLFGTRVAPSMPFDILGKGFGKVQLVLTIVALTIGTMFVAPMVKRKQINSRWAAV
ncbi:hypothetical protein BZA05DRAFT_347370 [Tricharina praecox]|uniref:uncharacterized protein n=1 Tax=Tricharina praecox TaxID=43433 RepID=UPI00221EE969|nr:uncharacterized protein BZA05DRAFT_347370 [Tricharina praecox]KAI5857871.1 hypothetical protein BZA05DRAFT_347370 [Tricharina praecox]